MQTQTPSPETETRPPRRSLVARIFMAAALSIGLAAGAAAPAQAANPYERGPNPTEQSVTALRGPFSTSETSVSSLRVRGFGGGTIYYPTTRSEGTFGGVVISPGYTGTQSSIAWLGPRLASQGFVVFTIDTNTIYDQPNSRARQLDAALDYLTEDSSVADRVDPNRLAAMGHSMGGGGTLALSEDRPELRAAIPLTPWHTQKRWSSLQVPTMIIGAENDAIASVRTHSIPFYESLPSSLDRAYVELRGASHFAPNLSNTVIAKYSISWLKRFVDEDTRYNQFLCPPPRTGFGTDFSDYRDSCPH